MTEIDPGELERAARAEGVTLLDAGAPDLVPAWQPVLLGDDADARCAAALGLWNNDFRAFVPTFSAALDSRLLDVRAGRIRAESGGDQPVLIYLLRSVPGHIVTWVGHDPRTYTDPIFAGVFPAPMLTFLREVHPGFAATDGIRFGMMPPAQMVTLAESVGQPDGIPGFDHLHDIGSTRLVWVSENQSYLRYLLSPDLPLGSSVFVYEGDFDIGDAGAQLDELMMIRLTLPPTG